MGTTRSSHRPAVEPTGLARLPLLLLSAAEELGLDRDALMSSAGLSHEEISDPDLRVPFRKVVGIWRAAVAAAPGRDLGLLFGRKAVARDFGLVGYTMLHSATLREALKRLARYSRIMADTLELNLEEDSRGGRVTVGAFAPLDTMRHPIDGRLAGILTLAREITGVSIEPVQVRFPYKRPRATAGHRALFKAPLIFGAETAALLLRGKDLDRPVLQADSTLGGYLDQLAGSILASLKTRGSFADSVRRALWPELNGGEADLEGIAGRLGVSSRTLQRRLREEGTSFAEVLESFRREMALHLLGERSLAVYEVAYLLGYSEPSTFYRAFRRWERVSPREFRRSLS